MVKVPCVRKVRDSGCGRDKAKCHYLRVVIRPERGQEKTREKHGKDQRGAGKRPERGREKTRERPRDS